MAVYIIWVHIDPAPESGGRMSPWLRSIRFWKFFAEYYPATSVPLFPLPML
jgi:2-acylglycerol O-acyltransferase 2